MVDSWLIMNEVIFGTQRVNGPSPLSVYHSLTRAPMLGHHQQTSKNDASGFKAKGGAADILNAVNMEVTQEALMDNVKGELEQTAKAEYKDKLAEWETAQKKAQIAEKDDYDDLDEDDDFMEQMKQKRLDDLQKKCVASARKLWRQQRSSTGSGARARALSLYGLWLTLTLTRLPPQVRTRAAIPRGGSRRVPRDHRGRVSQGSVRLAVGGGALSPPRVLPVQDRR